MVHVEFTLHAQPGRFDSRLERPFQKKIDDAVLGLSKESLKQLSEPGDLRHTFIWLLQERLLIGLAIRLSLQLKLIQHSA